ncbi:hypothetical protein D9M72_575910 [compost metagenome]
MTAGHADAVLAREHPEIAAIGANDVLGLRVCLAGLEHHPVGLLETFGKLAFDQIPGGTAENGILLQIMDQAEGLVDGDIVKVAILDADRIGLGIEDLFGQLDALQVRLKLLVALLLVGNVADRQDADAAR